MIIVTGSAGFIGSCLISELNNKGFEDLIIVDDFSYEIKKRNYIGKKYFKSIQRDDFIYWFSKNYDKVDFVFHIGARTDTVEFDYSVFERLNINYSKSIWHICASKNIPLIFASSAATYGNGEYGFDDKHEIVEKLLPLNPYGKSKNEFDKWALKQKKQPPYWAGMKFFNVYGPNEYHKNRMASVIFHAFHQIKENSSLKIFRSHKANYDDGMQLRDFVYVKDVVDGLIFLFENGKNSGLYNLGTGNARSFLDLAKAVFRAMDVPESISFIDIPEDIRENYQYFTEANMNKLKKEGYKNTFTTLEDGILDYVKKYLKSNFYY